MSNGTRVLGLGDIGPRAALPVMESKALFYGELVGLNAVALVLDAMDVDAFVDTVVRISPTFAGIHLEDIKTPECFEIKQRLIQRLSIPVMHDDQHGTAVVAVAAMRNMAKASARTLADLTVVQIGLAVQDWPPRIGQGRRCQVGAGRRSGPRRPAIRPEPGRADRVDARSAADGRSGLPGHRQAGPAEAADIRRGQLILALSNPRRRSNPPRRSPPGRLLRPMGEASTTCCAIRGCSRGRLRRVPGRFRWR